MGRVEFHSWRLKMMELSSLFMPTHEDLVIVVTPVPSSSTLDQKLETNLCGEAAIAIMRKENYEQNKLTLTIYIIYNSNSLQTTLAS